MVRGSWTQDPGFQAVAQGTDLNMGIVSIKVALEAETLDKAPMKDESLA